MRRGRLPAALVAGVLALALVACEDLLQEPDTGTSPGPVHLELVSGDGQTGPAGSALPAPVRVRIVDGEGRPMSRMRVEWTPGPGGGRVDPRNGFTDADGVAAATWTLGSSLGTQELSAGLGPLQPIVFSATVTP